MLVTIANIGDTDIELNNDEGHPWLSFQVMGEKFRDNFLPVHTERQSNFAPMELKVGKSKTFDVNITPLYSFRSEGNYRVSAVIDLPGAGEIVSDPVSFAVQRGARGDERRARGRFAGARLLARALLALVGIDRAFICAWRRRRKTSSTPTTRSGELVSSVDPTMLFDPQGDVHILQPTALGTYLYSRTDPDGKVLDQRAVQVHRVAAAAAPGQAGRRQHHRPGRHGGGHGAARAAFRFAEGRQDRLAHCAGQQSRAWRCVRPAVRSGHDCRCSGGL